MEKINIAEILKDCPAGMKLDCTLFEGLEFDGIVDNEFLPIRCRIKNPKGGYTVYNFTKYGCWLDATFAKCVIFPKGKTTWKGFVPPCKFKDGDIIFVHTNALKCDLDNSWVAIFKEYRNNRCACYMCLCLSGLEFYHDKWEDELLCELCEMEESRLATEEEKQKLFDAIKENGYKWNAETKTLEKLIEPKFKVGDRVKRKEVNYTHIVTIVEIDGEYYTYVNQNGEPASISIKNQDKWELVPNKFDINTLNPFDKVLVRLNNDNQWYATWFSHIDEKYESYGSHYVTVAGKSYTQMIPYKGNEHLLGKTDDCDEYYKTWK